MAAALDVKGIQEAIRQKYAQVSCSPTGYFAYPTGKIAAAALGYDGAIVEAMPSTLVDSFCGVGNPFGLGLLHAGEAVLDVGCGAGFDLVAASYLVGPMGRVYGIDLTPEMIETAGQHLRSLRVAHVEVQLAGSEAIPYPDNTFDVVISIGVLNLSPMKEQSFWEIHRVLKPNGRLQIADMVLKEELPREGL
jgi:2-polyprenyl-3-methyl-5-hydroxy-6-metoxy-1,4-benzoquinol methylase